MFGKVFIATSLDGFIARQDGSIDWLTPFASGAEDHGYAEFMDSVDGIVMGRGTFETVLQFEPWPYAKPVVVMSRTLDEADVPGALRDRVRVTRDAPRELAARLQREGWRRGYIDGGEVIRSFLKAGLVEDMTITRVPVLIGTGRPLFGPLGEDLALEHVSTRTFASGLVSSLYAIPAS